MKKLVIILFTIFVLCLTLAGCDGTKAVKKWDCSVTIPKNTTEIIINDTLIQNDTNQLTIQNQSKTDIIWYLYDITDKTVPLRQEEIKGDGVVIQYELKNNINYCIGVQADVSEDTDITIIISNSENTDPY